MWQVWGGILALTGFVACPCHLPFTLPLLVAVLGGTGAGGFIASNTGLVYGAAAGYFLAGIPTSLYLLNPGWRGSRAGDRQAEQAIRAGEKEESSWPTSSN